MPERRLALFFESLLDRRLGLPICRYPHERRRRLVRRLLGSGPGGMERFYLNLVKGLDGLGVDYTVNDYRGARRRRQREAELLCVVGKPFVLDKVPRESPLLFGPATHSHPSDDPDLLARHDVRRILVPCEWMRRMCEPYWGDRVRVWPVGIETDLWAPAPEAGKTVDVLVYDKLRWPRHLGKRPAIERKVEELRGKGLRVEVLTYGRYREADYHALLARSRALVFFCEHETQGIAYLQALSSGVPILAWDEVRTWEDPDYYPHRVRYAPVTSVPYFDGRCGWSRDDLASTLAAIEDFVAAAAAGEFRPREYVVENLSLEGQAAAYLRHADEAAAVAAA